MSDFLASVIQGLGQMPKHLPSMYFYDEAGSELFRCIMALPEYYLTRAETAILHTHSREMWHIFLSSGRAVSMVELGAGDGVKTAILLQNFHHEYISLDYTAIDISEKALSDLSTHFEKYFFNFDIQTVRKDYFTGLQELNTKADTRKVVLFLGSNLGNFSPESAIIFLQNIRKNIRPGDYLLLGLDLQKDPDILLPAYHDAQGITRAFNLNLLQRINRELGGNFDLHAYRHYPYYDAHAGAMRSCLISLKRQQIHIAAAEQDFSVEAWEPIHTEISHKYTLAQIAQYAAESGFQPIEYFFDENAYFCDVIYQAIDTSPKPTP